MHGEHDTACLFHWLSSCAESPFTHQLRKTLVSNLHIPIHSPGPEATRGHLGLRRPSKTASLQLWPLPLWASCQALGYKQQRPHSPRLLMPSGTHLGAERPGPITQDPTGGLNVHSVLRPLGKAPELFSAPGILPRAPGVLPRAPVCWFPDLFDPARCSEGVSGKLLTSPGTQERAGLPGHAQQMSVSCRLMALQRRDQDCIGLLSAGLAGLIFPLGKKKLKGKKICPSPRDVCLGRTKAGNYLALTNRTG